MINQLSVSALFDLEKTIAKDIFDKYFMADTTQDKIIRRNTLIP